MGFPGVGHMWKALQAVAIVLLLSTSAMTAQKAPKADDILKAAKQKAADENKAIFLIFEASWCESCHQLDIFLALPEIAAIFNKYFVIANLTFGEGADGHPDWDTPGVDSLVLKYGGMSSDGDVALPFIAILDAKARLIVNSNQPGKSKAGSSEAGFPTEPEEIKSFLSMLEKGAPSLTEAELRKIQNGLRRAAAD